MFDLTVACASDIGNHHPVNQDAGGAWVFRRGDGTRAGLLVVADGVSAGRHSEVASRLTVERLRERAAPVLADVHAELADCLQVVVDAIADVNRELSRRPHSSVANADATTVVSAVIVGERAAGAWVGDSRVYRANGSAITRLTVDHSWAEGVVSRGLMSRAQAAADPRAHVILRWLGPPEDRDIGIETFETELSPDDIILCCTDGLYMYFTPPAGEEEEIALRLARGPDLESGLDDLIEAALKRGGYDNITAAAARLSS